MFGISVTWEKYYSTLRQLPERLRRPVPFLAEIIPTFERRKIKSVLDLGCGTGRNSIFLAKSGFDVICVDVSKSALTLANKWAKKEKLTNATFTHGSMINMPFDDCCFDAVVSVSVIHHGIKEDIRKTVTEIHRLLKKDGFFLANLASVNDPRYGEGEKVEENTFSILEAFEDKRFKELHHFFTRKEACEVLKCFSQATVEILEEKPKYWKVAAVK